MSLFGQEATLVRGNFSLSFPEVQTVTLRARNDVTNGTFKLVVRSHQTAAEAGTVGGLVETVENTTCLSWHSTPNAMRKALEATSFVGHNGVRVTRSGDGTEWSTSPFG
jgi:hypothetical protein